MDKQRFDLNDEARHKIDEQYEYADERVSASDSRIRPKKKTELPLSTETLMRRIELLTGSRRGLRRGLLLSVAPAMLSAQSLRKAYPQYSTGGISTETLIIADVVERTSGVKPVPPLWYRLISE